MLFIMPLPEFKTFQEIIDFEDFESLTDEELLEFVALQLEAIEKLKPHNPEFTDEFIEDFKEKAEIFENNCHEAKNAEKTAAAAWKKVEKSAEALLMHTDLPDGKPLPMMPKRRGN